MLFSLNNVSGCFGMRKELVKECFYSFCRNESGGKLLFLLFNVIDVTL